MRYNLESLDYNEDDLYETYALPNIEVPHFDANWDSMWLGYEDEWPLGLLFTPQVIAR